MAESIIYLHGVPNSGEMWQPFVEVTGGMAPDLPGFGASDKPANGDYTFRGLGRYVSELIAGMDRVSLVMHDWGAVGLLAAMERPEAIERIVLFDAVPFLPGYRWHPVARIWRTPVLGELFMGLSTRWGALQLAKREAGNRLPRAAIEQQVDQIWKHFDHGTQRAILRLYRSAPEDVLAKTGEGLGRIEAPALVVWGGLDPYLPTGLAQAYGKALGGEATVEIADGAGHWPWGERPELIGRVAEFLAG
jgi:pimeloyl-ACP methyl ester carboxylesterase